MGMGTASKPPQIRQTAGPTEMSVSIDGNGALEKKLRVATLGLLGTREEVTRLRREVASLQVLVARLREDEVGVWVCRRVFPGSGGSGFVWLM